VLPVIQGERGGVIAGERGRDVKAPPGVARRGLVFTASPGRSVSSPVPPYGAIRHRRFDLGLDESTPVRLCQWPRPSRPVRVWPTDASTKCPGSLDYDPAIRGKRGRIRLPSDDDLSVSVVDRYVHDHLLVWLVSYRDAIDHTVSPERPRRDPVK
jgi:hypothetical protein